MKVQLDFNIFILLSIAHASLVEHALRKKLRIIYAVFL